MNNYQIDFTLRDIDKGEKISFKTSMPSLYLAEADGWHQLTKYMRVKFPAITHRHKLQELFRIRIRPIIQVRGAA